MKYHGSDVEVTLGDQVVYKHLFFGTSKGVVAYVPGISDTTADKYYDTPDWVVKLDNGKSVFMLYHPALEFAHRRIRFVRRTGQTGS
jgi:hypothetical protein